MFKDLYLILFQKQRDKDFIRLCEEKDKENNGTVPPEALESALMSVSSDQFSKQEISDFVAQLARDKITGKISYLPFLSQVTNLGNRDHNPFQKVLQKLEIFIHENKVDALGLLKRIGAKTSDGVSVE